MNGLMPSMYRGSPERSQGGHERRMRVVSRKVLSGRLSAFVELDLRYPTVPVDPDSSLSNVDQLALVRR
jgi:hypothetical protein